MMIRIGLFVAMALGLCGFGVVAWISVRPPQTAEAANAPAPPPPAQVKVLIAGHPLQAGSLLRPEDVGAHEMLQSAMPPGASIDTPEARGLLIGAMIRRSLGAGETLVSADITRPGDHGFLAAVLGPGMRAITVGVDAVSGTAGLIWPGDRVDVILTEAAGGGDRQHISALRVLTDARVIAIDQQLVQGVTANSSTAPQPLARTVTLEVSDGEAERVAVATHLGSLSLAVRSADRGAATIADAPRVVWGTDISPAQPETTTMAPPTVRLWLGAADGKEFHF